VLYKLIDLKKRYHRRTVLDVENLSLEKGRVFGLSGPNGAGKTTLLEIMAFLLSPTAGQVFFDGQKVDLRSRRLLHLRRKVVLVQQQPILLSNTTAKNVEFPLAIRNAPKRRREAIVEGLLEVVGMAQFRHAMAQNLSGGETQRIAIARALACSPEVILLDEPTANVDAENQIIIERIIKEINRNKGISVFFATHDMIQASRLADETLFMFEGKVTRSVVENIFNGHIETDTRGDRYCVLQNGLRLRVQSERTGRVRISVKPIAIKISKRDPVASSENLFRGRLVQLTDERKRVRALVDIGIPLNVLIPKDAMGNMRLVIGEEVCLSWPMDAIEFF
jgi:tungstate transport system ATP-binding protein